MSLQSLAQGIRSGGNPKFPSNATAKTFAEELDAQDSLAHLRDQFVLPTKASLKKTALSGTLPGAPKSAAAIVNGYHGVDDTISANGSTEKDQEDDAKAIYFVGNSLGAQPKAVRTYLSAQLETWASIGVNGHFTDMTNSPLSAWQDLAADCARKCAPIVGAHESEVVIMNTLSANLHLMMASFYRPEGRRNKVILERRPFPSDWYVIESQIKWHGLDPQDSMVLIHPEEETYYIPVEKVLATIDEHADETALLLLPGIQYYSGQLFDIQRITAYAQARGIVVGWDLAHAAGNVELQLHDWNVDWACWCTYKYMCAGPGAIAGAFVHERHGRVEKSESGAWEYRPRLTGWYGHDKATRFNMDNRFQPSQGAAGFQVSNPSAIDLASLSAALSVFEQTSMRELRSKALVLTAYAQFLLDAILADWTGEGEPPFKVITPRDPRERGTQLSVLLREELMDGVSAALVEGGVVCDKRKPGVIRVAPKALYCTFENVHDFMQIFSKALGVELRQ